MLDLHVDAIIDSIQHYTADALNKAGAMVLRTAKTNCPKKTGNLRRGIKMTTATTDNLEVAVYNDVEYAPYVEVGTEKMDAQPFMQPAVEENRTAILETFENLF